MLMLPVSTHTLSEEGLHTSQFNGCYPSPNGLSVTMTFHTPYDVTQEDLFALECWLSDVELCLRCCETTVSGTLWGTLRISVSGVLVKRWEWGGES